ncbi:MAG: trehalose-6-phosphate synthase [Bdellovibrionales bacterium]
MPTTRLALSFILPLVTILGLIAYGVIPLFQSATRRWFIHDLEERSHVLVSALREPLREALDSGSPDKVSRLFSPALHENRLFAAALCTAEGVIIYKTPRLPDPIGCASAATGLQKAGVAHTIVELSEGDLHVSRYPLEVAGVPQGELILTQDMGLVDRRVKDTRLYLFYLFVVLGVVVSIVTVIIAQVSWRRLTDGMASLLAGIRRSGPKPLPRAAVTTPELLPLAKDLRALIRDLDAEHRMRDESQVSWTPKALKLILNEELAGDEIMIVSNREPYIHNYKNGQIDVSFPASGLVTALEPVMRACSGTWVAHGSGSADKDVVNRQDHVQVPPDNPTYQIRRVWLTKEEEQGYYYGFSNEGLWPLCHMAYTRPTFRTEDYEHYRRVNQKFADVVVEEARTENPVVLVQDYHLALVPRMVRNRLPQATIITFWHIPWPNPEAFGICPWREEILDGLLGSSILGFHTLYHCINFIDTVDRFLESRVDRETSTISFGGKLTAIKSYPISIEWPARWTKDLPSVEECRRHIREINAFPRNHLVGIGVDRLDYTKGILERFFAIERLLEKHPEWIGRFTFVQIAAPSRSSIPQYKDFEQEVRNQASRINKRFGDGTYMPICLKIEHHSPRQVVEYFRASEVAMVTSLHDGMNLVAKEFVAARDDERGVLILSQFTGASRELQEALVVNPYDIDQCASALNLALAMPWEEQRDRMRSMRGLIQEFNVYRWAGRMLMDAARMRQHDRLVHRIQEIEHEITQ